MDAEVARLVALGAVEVSTWQGCRTLRAPTAPDTAGDPSRQPPGARVCQGVRVHGRRRPATAAAGAGALVVGLCGCSFLPSGVPRSMAARNGDAVVACRQAVQERLQVPDVDGLGAGVDHVWVGERWHGWYVEGVASSAADVPTTDFSCRVAADEASGPSLEVSDLQVGACEEGTADRRCGELP